VNQAGKKKQHNAGNHLFQVTVPCLFQRFDGILQQQGAYPTAGLPSSCKSIMFNNMVVQAVVNNKPIPEAPQPGQDNFVGLLEKFYLLGFQRSEKIIRFNPDSAFERRFLFKIDFCQTELLAPHHRNVIGFNS
jgi:hypothetical protein